MEKEKEPPEYWVELTVLDKSPDSHENPVSDKISDLIGQRLIIGDEPLVIKNYSLRVHKVWEFTKEEMIERFAWLASQEYEQGPDLEWDEFQIVRGIVVGVQPFEHMTPHQLELAFNSEWNWEWESDYLRSTDPKDRPYKLIRQIKDQVMDDGRRVVTVYSDGSIGPERSNSFYVEGGKLVTMFSGQQDLWYEEARQYAESLLLPKEPILSMEGLRELVDSNPIDAHSLLKELLENRT